MPLKEEQPPMAKLTEREELEQAEREAKIDALLDELRTVDVRKIIGGLREQVRQWRESDTYATWPPDMQGLTEALSGSIDLTERALAIHLLFTREAAQRLVARIDEHMAASAGTIKGS